MLANSYFAKAAYYDYMRLFVENQEEILIAVSISVSILGFRIV